MSEEFSIPISVLINDLIGLEESVEDEVSSGPNGVFCESKLEEIGYDNVKSHLVQLVNSLRGLHPYESTCESQIEILKSVEDILFFHPSMPNRKEVLASFAYYVGSIPVPSDADDFVFNILRILSKKFLDILDVPGIYKYICAKLENTGLLNFKQIKLIDHLINDLNNADRFVDYYPCVFQQFAVCLKDGEIQYGLRESYVVLFWRVILQLPVDRIACFCNRDLVDPFVESMLECVDSFTSYIQNLEMRGFIYLMQLSSNIDADPFGVKERSIKDHERFHEFVSSDSCELSLDILLFIETFTHWAEGELMV